MDHQSRGAKNVERTLWPPNSEVAAAYGIGVWVEIVSELDAG